MSLELMDAFINDGRVDDLFSWYGVLSSDLATNYPDVLKNKQRKKKLSQYHRDWAKAAPIQYVKSEVIIKLNKVINRLSKH